MLFLSRPEWPADIKKGYPHPSHDSLELAKRLDEVGEQDALGQYVQEAPRIFEYLLTNQQARCFGLLDSTSQRNTRIFPPRMRFGAVIM